MATTNIYGQADEGEAITTFHQALDGGLNFIDTSDAYGGGKNEDMVRRTLEGHRDWAVLATKFGNLGSSVNVKLEYVVEACDKSLGRLGVDVIGIYFQHQVDADVPIEDTVGAMSRLVDAGKVRWLGLSKAGSETIRRAYATHPICALQTKYSLWSRFVEDNILPIPGSKQRTHMAENMVAEDIKLVADEVAKIGAVIVPEDVSGTRYPKGQLKRLGI